MLLVRLLVLIAVMGNWNSNPPAAWILQDAEVISFPGIDDVLTDAQRPLLHHTNITLDALAPQVSGGKLPKVDSLTQRKNVFTVINQYKGGSYYYEFCKTLNLRLNTRSICYPFHSFP